MLRHVDVFSTSEPFSLAGITYSAISDVTSSRSTKDGVDYVLLPRLVGPITRSWILVSGRPGSVDRSDWGNYSFHKLSQVAIPDQQLDLVSKLYAVLRVVAHVLVEVAVFVLVSSSTICSDWLRVPE
ncbi:hypothetical protein TIFTF001_023064 [Ficus carica]|uniref:Uncharacterized protein n=1 Tax=Ficus carica TaxID=3494 RepID=A0AA88DDB9_FICCA|nr:hypothetical protein TIFTF001_023064 [Ficus carica]